MRPLISLFTAASVALHLVLGCCAHHGHASDGMACAKYLHGTRHSSHFDLSQVCPHHHGKSPSADEKLPADTDSHPHPTPSHDGCDGVDCAFMIAGKAQLPDMAPAMAMATVAPLFSRVVPIDAVRYEVGEFFWPAVRPHLAHQVLLN